MGHPVTDQGAGPGKNAIVGKEWVSLASHRADDCSVEIDQVSMIAGDMSVIVHSMGIMANRTRSSSSRDQMQTMTARPSHAATDRPLLKRSVTQNIVPVMAIIAQGIRFKIFRSANLTFITLSQNRTVLGAMRTIGASPSYFGALITVVTIRTVDDTGGV